jgi:threonine dehydratase
VTVPDLDAIRAAAARIAPHARVTPVLRSDALDARAGAQLLFKCENLQRGGAFKFRGACNAVWSLDADAAARGVATHSSGNHGTALALAAASRGIPAHVVVPEGAVQAKLDAIIAAGGIVHRCAPTQADREATAEAVCADTGAHLVHPYADARVMAGQGTIGLELAQQAPVLDAVLVPVGGGGLAAGTAVALHGLSPGLPLLGVEPEGAADAALSLACGRRVTHVVPDTLCDGLRATIGEPNLAALRQHAVEILTVSDDETVAAMRLLWHHLKVVVEPSSATVLAAVMRYRERLGGRRLALVLTGGNVDLDALPW